MMPTLKLRFVERETGRSEQYDVKVTERHGTEVCYRPQKIRVLQQWWEVAFYDDNQQAYLTTGEWRDVPLENEE